MSLDLYITIGVIFGGLNSLQWISMLYNNFTLPKFHLIYYSEDELVECRRLVKEFYERHSDKEESSIRKIIVVISILYCMITAVFWPFYVFKEVVKFIFIPR